MTFSAVRRRGWKLLVLAAVLALPATGALGAERGAGATQPRVVLVTSPACTLLNFLCPGFERAVKRVGVRGRIVSPDEREDRVGTLSLIARQGYALVIVDPGWIDELAIVGPRFPTVRFAVLDAPVEYIKGRPRNAEAVLTDPHEAAFLAGWLAARLEQRRPGRDVVGVVGGIAFPPVERFVTGFRAGARRADPGIAVLTGYSQDFSDPNKCEAIARSQIARGAGAVFNVAGECGYGTLDAAKEAGVWGIGVDIDQSFLGPHILTSVLKRLDTAAEVLIRRALRGTPPARRTIAVGLRNGGAGLAPVSARVPAAVRAEVERVRRRIVSGGLKVP